MSMELADSHLKGRIYQQREADRLSALTNTLLCADVLTNVVSRPTVCRWSTKRSTLHYPDRLKLDRPADGPTFFQ